MIPVVISQRTYPDPRRILGDDQARFWSKVDMPFRPYACWTWLAGVNGDGYGTFMLTDAPRVTRAVGAHRWAYEDRVGPIAAGMELDHLCKNHRCVRPDHLEQVTHRENVLRGDAPAAKILRRQTCPEGHPYDVVEGRYRRCSICRAANRRPV